MVFSFMLENIRSFVRVYYRDWIDMWRGVFRGVVFGGGKGFFFYNRKEF